MIIRARTMAQLEDNLRSAALTLPSEETAELGQAGALPELYPYFFIGNYGRKRR